ncbi:MAG: tetratricopeptide repeat protein [Saprospiraceae bacterium]|nr:tetratricopeptide repeat protein [Saprospiraceae bacterium]
MNKKLLAIFLIVSITFTFCTSKSEQAKKFFADGKTKFYNNEFKTSIADFDKAIELQADLYEAYYFRGSCYMNLREYEIAIKDYDMVIELKPDYADAYVNRGHAKAYLYNDQSKGCEDWLKAEELGKPNLSDKTKWCK